MYTHREGDTLTVDIHGMKVLEAKFRLESLIEACSPEINKIVVIHGFNSGQALKNLVRNDLEAPRIKRVIAAYNAGQSVIELRKKKLPKQSGTDSGRKAFPANKNNIMSKNDNSIETKDNR